MTGSRSDHPFALCLTHDVDRPYKLWMQSLYYLIAERRLDHLGTIGGDEEAYWQFETVMELESDLGVRSAFYFLSEPRFRSRSPRELASLHTWIQMLNRYDIRESDLADVVRRLHAGGWEIGLHGSSATPTDRERLRVEKRRIERLIDAPILGGRQHYLDLVVPDTWEHHRAVGLAYDSSLGSSTEYGFEHGYDVLRPFDDHFVVFPLTLMEDALPDPSTQPERAWAACESLLDEAAEHGAVMTVLWHPRLFAEREFPGYRGLYRRLVEAALDRGAWVGPPGTYYKQYLADVDTEASPSAVSRYSRN